MIDFARLKKLYKFSLDLSLNDIQSLLKASKIETFKAQSYLMEQGSLNRKVYFITKGLVRFFIVNDKGDEITTLIRWENQTFLNPDVIFFEKPSRFYIQALEDTKAFTLDYDQLQAIIEQNPKLEKNRKHILLNVIKETLTQRESFVLYSPEERYLNFVQTKPDIVNRVPGKYIANILGITPVSLSRIRKRLATKKATH